MRFVFLMTHMGAGVSQVCDSLNRVPGVCATQTNRIYTHPSDLEGRDRYARTFVDAVLFNCNFASPALYRCAKFVYLLRPPKESLGSLVREGYSRDSAVSYYLFRLRRLYEAAHQTPGSAFLTWDDVRSERGRALLADFLGVNGVPEVKDDGVRAESWVPDRGYAKYLPLFRKLDLRTVDRE